MLAGFIIHMSAFSITVDFQKPIQHSKPPEIAFEECSTWQQALCERMGLSICL